LASDDASCREGNELRVIARAWDGLKPHVKAAILLLIGEEGA